MNIIVYMLMAGKHQCSAVMLASLFDHTAGVSVSQIKPCFQLSVATVTQPELTWLPLGREKPHLPSFWARRSRDRQQNSSRQREEPERTSRVKLGQLGYHGNWVWGRRLSQPWLVKKTGSQVNGSCDISGGDGENFSGQLTTNQRAGFLW